MSIVKVIFSIKGLLLLALALSSFCMNAQNKRFSFYAELNPRINSVYHEQGDYYKFTPTFGYGANALLNYKLNKRFALATGLGYDYLKLKNRDYTSFVHDGAISIFDESEYNYLNIPFKIKITLGKYEKHFLYIGFTRQQLMSYKRDANILLYEGGRIKGYRFTDFEFEGNTPQSQWQWNLSYIKPLKLTEKVNATIGLKLDYNSTEILNRDSNNRFPADKEWRAFGVGMVFGVQL